MKKCIVCFHLFNDYSGSPKVLNMVLDGMLERGYKVDLVSSKGGVLDELLRFPNIRKYSYRYRFSTNGAVTMLRYTIVQIYTFFLAFRWMFSKNTLFYVNTLLPVGPALAGRLMGKRVVYHYHENAFVKGFFYKTLALCMQKLAHEIICVSAYQASFLNRKDGVAVVPNALPQEFVNKLQPDKENAFKRKRVLMLGSLKLYKSPLEFIALSKKLRLFDFELVVNDTQDNLDKFIDEYKVDIPQNLRIYPRQSDVAPFYNRASLVLNLSDKNKIIETFGLTALEAMAAGLPVIVPTVGGIAEMVEDGVNGYKTDVQQMESIAEHITMILSDKGLYSNLSDNALRYAERYSAAAMIDNIISHF